MRRFAFVAVLVLIAISAAGAYAQSWILPIDHRDGGGWVELPGAGYNGASAWEGSGMDGVRRVYWSLVGSGAPVGTHLYAIEVWAPLAGGRDWQPIESQFEGSAGEIYPVDPNIPWQGMWGTNHQYIGSDAFVPGDWNVTGPGPHTPETADPAAGANGIHMWLTDQSFLYAKWDFGWPIDRSWSALRISVLDDGNGDDDDGEHAIPEASSLALALIGGLPALAAIRRRH